MTCGRKWVKKNPKDAEGKKELTKVDMKWVKVMARCPAKGMQLQEINSVNEEGDVKDEEPEVEVEPEMEVKDET